MQIIFLECNDLPTSSTLDGRSLCNLCLGCTLGFARNCTCGRGRTLINTHSRTTRSGAFLWRHWSGSEIRATWHFQPSDVIITIAKFSHTPRSWIPKVQSTSSSSFSIPHCRDCNDPSLLQCSSVQSRPTHFSFYFLYYSPWYNSPWRALTAL